MTYPKEYCAEIRVFDAKGRILKEYKITGHAKEWAHLIMLFYYPYQSIEKAAEKIYSQILHDVFKGIESDRLFVVN